MPAGKRSPGVSYLARVSVDHLSPEPLYLQLAGIIRGRIAAGEWSRGPLPSNRTLQETYDVGEYVVTRAVRLLEDEGIVFTVPRRGVYVRQQPE
jgi:GntR family transcriptional regulator